MRSIFDNLLPEEVLRAVIQESQEALTKVQELSNFLIDPSAGFLTQHQKKIAYQIYQNSEHLAYIMEELGKYQQSLGKDSE